MHASPCHSRRLLLQHVGKINNKALGLQVRSEELSLNFKLSLLSWSDNIFTIGPKFEEVTELTKK